MRIFVCGGLGFMGSDFIRFLFETVPGIKVLNLDKMTYAGNPANVAAVAKNPRYHFERGDIANERLVDRLVKQFKPELVVNYAAETHVDRSILDPKPFIQTDIVGTQVLLESVRKFKIPRYIQISTDEVYGSIVTGKFTEQSPLAPNSPYSASKAGGDLMVRAYAKTFGVPALITRSCNNYGPYQYPEKLISLFITNLLEGRDVPLYGSGRNVREWIYVRDHSRAVWLVAQKGKLGEVYNIGNGNEITNLELTRTLLKLLKVPASRIKFVKDRLGHDLRYALDGGKIKRLGFKPAHKFDQALAATVNWYKDNEAWWRPIKSGEYQDYYKKNYGTAELLKAQA